MMAVVLTENWRLHWAYIPNFIYVLLVIALCLVVVLLGFKGFKNGRCNISRLLLFEYIIILYCSTIFFRHIAGDRDFNFLPFWSYYSFIKGENDHLLIEDILNIIVFVPIGILLWLSFRSFTWKKAFLIGGGLSLVIEVLQFIFNKGFSELDDVIHNTLGCLIGYGIMNVLFHSRTRKV